MFEHTFVAFMWYRLSNSDFELPRFNTVRFGKHSSRYLGPHQWEKLPKKSREAPSLASFKRDIQKMDVILLESSGCHSCVLCNTKLKFNEFKLVNYLCSYLQIFFLIYFGKCL